ncbi:hypothetical protein HQ560_04665 [bacterium]|nr:hypothetical protein [bacterium]
MSGDELAARIRAVVEPSIDASSALIAVHSFAAAADLLCRALDDLAGFLEGRTTHERSREAFLAFAERYVPGLGAAPADAALTEAPKRPLRSCAELVYVAWCAGMFQDEGRSGVRVVDDKRGWLLAMERDGTARLNVIPLQSRLERGRDLYLADLTTDGGLAHHAACRAAFLARPLLLPHDPVEAG